MSLKQDPRPYQQKCVDELVKYDKAIIHAPTGSGKTNIIAYLINELKERAIVIVPALDLVKQTKDRFEKIVDKELSIGTIDGSVLDKKSQANKDIVITTWQSISRSKNLLTHLKGKHQMLIIDECHHSSANVLSSIIDTLATDSKRVYGVSATPYRSSGVDERTLKRLFDGNIAYRVDVEDLYKDGYLVRPKINIITTQYPNYKLDRVAEESYLRKLLTKKAQESQTYNDFIDSVFKLGYVALKEIKLNDNLHFYRIVKTLPNGNTRDLNSDDITNIKNFFKSCYKTLNSDKARMNSFIFNILTTFKDSFYTPKDFYSTSFLYKKIQDEYFDNASRVLQIYAKKLFLEKPNLKPSSWSDIGMKVGYLKKGIDLDQNRTQEILYFLNRAFNQKDSIKALVLANTTELSKRMAMNLKIFSNKAKVFYLDGKSKDKERVFEAIRNLGDNNNFILVSTTSLIKEGIDLPPVDFIAQISPVFNPINSIFSTEQLIGRAIRPYKNKTSAEVVIFDANLKDFSSRKDEILNIVANNLQPTSIKLYRGVISYFNDEDGSKSSNIDNSIQENNKLKTRGGKDMSANNYKIKDFNLLTSYGNQDLFAVYDENDEIKQGNFIYSEDGKVYKLTIDNFDIDDIEIKITEEKNAKIKLSDESENLVLDDELIEIVKNSTKFSSKPKKVIPNFVKNNYPDLKTAIVKNGKVLCLSNTKQGEVFSLGDFNFTPEISFNRLKLEQLDREEFLVINHIQKEKDSNKYYYTDVYGEKVYDIDLEILENGKELKDDTLFVISKRLLRKKERDEYLKNQSQKSNSLVISTTNLEELETEENQKFKKAVVEILDQEINARSIEKNFEFSEPKSKEEIKEYVSLELSQDDYIDQSLLKALKNIKLLSDENSFELSSKIKDIFDFIHKNGNNSMSPIYFKKAIEMSLDKLEELDLDYGVFLAYRSIDDCINNFKDKVLSQDDDREFSQALYNKFEEFDNIIFDDKKYQYISKIEMSSEDIVKINGKEYINAFSYDIDENTQRLYIANKDEIDAKTFVIDYDTKNEKVLKAVKINDNYVEAVLSTTDFTNFDNESKMAMLTRLKNSNYKSVSDHKLVEKEEKPFIKSFNTIKETIKKFINKADDLIMGFLKGNTNSLKELLDKNIYTKFFSKKKNMVSFVFRELVNNFKVDDISKEDFMLKTGVNLLMSNGFLGSVNYSTLQHSINVAKIVEHKLKKIKELSKEDKKEIVLKALLHDSVEAIAIGDLPTPIKNKMPKIREFEGELIKEFYEKLGIKDTQYNEIINKADKIERATFIELYFNNASNFQKSLEIFTQNYEKENKLVMSDREKLEFKTEIIRDYKAYLNDKPPLHRHSNDFIEMFKLNKKLSLVLSKDEYLDMGVDMKIGKSHEEIARDFIELANRCGFELSYDDFIKEYQKANQMELNLDNLDYKEKETKIIDKLEDILGIKVDSEENSVDIGNSDNPNLNKKTSIKP